MGRRAVRQRLRGGRSPTRSGSEWALPSPVSYRAKHRVAAMLAEQILRSAHADNGLMSAAVRALGDELVALQAVHAAVPASELGGSKPWLAAAGAGRPAHLRSLSSTAGHQ